MTEMGTSTFPPPPPPPTQRRPRVREVSSRFMSPLPPTSMASSSSSPLPSIKQRSSSVQKLRQAEPLSCTDENRGFIRSPPQRKCSVMKLFKENGGGPQPSSSRSLRPDTPTVITSSKLRLMQQRSTQNPSSAAKLLQNSGMSSCRLNQSNCSELSLSLSSSSSSPSYLSCDVLENDKNDKNEGNQLPLSCSKQSFPDLRSSMPEASSRLLIDRTTNDKNADNSKSTASPCSRSLDFPRYNTCEYSLTHSLKTADKPAMKKMTGLPLPPVAPYGNLSRKARKVHGHQEDVHSLRLLYNHHLQWRFANAKAEVSIRAQKRETERMIYSLGLKISELCHSVKQKRAELSLLQRTEALSKILEPQMPYLEEWSTFEEEYSETLMEAVQAFMNVSFHLPVNGNVRAELREVGEALNSAMKLMELIAFHVQSFMPKAEEMDNLISNLARVVGGERALIEECEHRLFTTYKSQVEECSICCQFIQLHNGLHNGL